MEVRCNFCGWDNPDGSQVCEKCHKPLHVKDVDDNSSQGFKGNDKATRHQFANDVSALKATVSESVAFKLMEKTSESKKCPDCGYELENGTCSNCGYLETLKFTDNIEDSNEKFTPDVKKTMRPDRKNTKEEKRTRFVLTPISESGESEGDLIDYTGSVVSLNRDNTDPENLTITTQVQAVVSYEDGKWFIEDKSELKTTLVRAERKIELQNGDWILLGNQLFRFDDITF